MKIKLIITVIAAALLVVFSCKKDPSSPGGNKIEIGQTAIDTVSYFTAKVSSTIAALGGNEITQHGHCWATEKEPTVESSKTELGKLEVAGTFSSELTGLEDNTTYYVRSYLTYKNGVLYGTEYTIKTLKTGLPVVSTAEVSNITLNTAQCGGVATTDSGLMVAAKGVCWDTTAIFSIVNCIGKTNEGDSLGLFVSELTGLNEGVTYSVKAYATNAKGTGYGEVKMFSTIPITLPEVTTAEISAVTINSAQSGGNVSSDGNGTVTTRGVVWSAVEFPTIENNDGISADGSGLGSFTSYLTNLQDGTIYYVRSYATNEKGTAYGDQKSFQTVGIGFPVLITNNVVNVTATTASCGGNISSAGNGSVTARGICWNLTGTPTLDNNINFTTDGTGIGAFSSSLTGLIEGTQYYVVAYATNETGTAYGEVKSFTTIDVSAPIVTTTIVSNIQTTSATSGGNVIDGGNSNVTQRGVCWNTSGNPTMENSLGQTTDGTGTGSFVSTLNGLEPGTVYFYRAYAINAEGTGYGEVKQFTTTGVSLPSVTTSYVIMILQTTASSGGNVSNDGNSPVTARGVCWSTLTNPTLTDSHTTNGSGTGSFTSYITGLTANTQYHVRAYATNSVGTAYGNEIVFTTLTYAVLPTVTTEGVINITSTNCTSGGNVTSDGGGTVTARGACWSTSSNPTISSDHTTDGSGTGVFVSSLTGLTANTFYYVRAYATNGAGTAYGNEVSFTTLLTFICGDQITYEGQDYNTVLIGAQCWFKENLNVGIRINGSQDQTDNGQVEKYCYNNIEANCDTYGGLYQWNEMMQYTTTAGAQGICPDGWHVPTDDEWKVLEGTVDTYYGVGNTQWDLISWRGFDAGKRLKTTTGWSSNTGTDFFGFSALPGGDLDINGNFGSLGYFGYLWSSTTFYRTLSSTNDGVYRDAGRHRNSGWSVSVRCLKD